MALHLKKIETRDLRIGMYVEALDRPWLETPYLLEGVDIRTEADIDQLRTRCEYAYIRSDDPANDDRRGRRNGVGAATIPPPGDHEPHSFRQELPVARKIHDNARGLIRTIHEEISENRRPDTAAVAEVVEQMMDSVARHPDALVWFSNLKSRDEYTAIHSLNVCMQAVALATFVGNDERAIKEMGVGALLHDVGKIKVPLAILNKPGKLTPSEYEQIKKHPQYGVEILEKASGLTQASLDIVRDHHERLNGRGYPRGLRGAQISYYTQIVAIADVYDAMTTDRVYQQGRTPAQALELMASFEGDFNDELLRQFTDYHGEYPIGTLVELNTGEVGLVIPSPERQPKPTVLLVLDYRKRRYFPQRVRDLMRFPKFFVNRMLTPGSYGVDIDDYAENWEA
ncbi:HD-GYP domain-containing protein [Salinisphaera sp.]|uniref:HD-GYP domain-containing protein n=1 Tax=Salinisphaera sp. TaxID=1914330 RepID=UPI000C507DB4|nr:HD-GYP domain-containing protein [Salinisphaera sp.]MBS63008.1 metal-dependent phosphohydrolase [Salinisphaera sp.]